MNGFFSPKVRVLNEPRNFRSMIWMMTRYLSSFLSMARTLATRGVICCDLWGSNDNKNQRTDPCAERPDRVPSTFDAYGGRKKTGLVSLTRITEPGVSTGPLTLPDSDCFH